MPAPDRYAVIGHPVAHSRSPMIHRLFAQQLQEPLEYEALDVSPVQLPQMVRSFFAAGGGGLNVTLPHKQAVIALLDRLSGRATRAGAVNTIVRGATGALLGDNTDGIGLVRDLTQNLSVPVAGRRVLLLGAGGAARGVLAPLLALAPSELVIANRTPARAHSLAQAFALDGPVRASSYAELAGASFDLIINATAASLEGEVPPLPDAVLSASGVCYDMAYGPSATAFVRWAQRHGAAQAFTGLGMLVEQAAEAFFLWRGVRPDTRAVLATLQQEPGSGR